MLKIFETAAECFDVLDSAHVVDAVDDVDSNLNGWSTRRRPLLQHSAAQIAHIFALAALAVCATLLAGSSMRKDNTRLLYREHLAQVERDTAKVHSLRLASLRAGPIEVGDLNIEIATAYTALQADVRRLATQLPRSAALEMVEANFRDYTRSLELQTKALNRGDLTAAINLAPPSFDAGLPALRNLQPVSASRHSSGRTWRLAGAGSLFAAFVLKAFHGSRRRATGDLNDTTRLLLQNSGAVLFAVDDNKRVTFFNDEAIKFFGTAKLDGRDLESLCTPFGALALVACTRSVLATGVQETVDISIGLGVARRFDAIVSPVITTTRSGARKTTGVVWDLHDTTSRQVLEHDLQHKAFHDHLTGLPNRALFRDRAGHALDRKARDGVTSQNVCVLFIDLDGFKHVNDSLGHEAGDELIVEVAFRLTSILRPGDTIARLGGDEFAVLLEDPRPKLADLMAERMLSVIQQPVRLRGRDVQIGASIGLAEAGNKSTVEEMLRNADTAMYAAKDRGKNRIERFNQMMFTEAMDRLELNGELRNAAESGHLHLMYQPIVKLETQRVVGVEALLRWHHPSRGIIPPTLFIPMAEESGTIVQIGRWVIRTALSHAQSFPEETPLRINVNVSARQIEEPDFVDFVASELERSGLPPSRLVLEITESLILEDLNVAIARLDAIKELGVRIAIDDFGTGYSSLSHLKRLPVDQLKIDRSFISDGFDNEQGSSFVRAIIELGATLGLDTVAEGIEDLQQMEWLRTAGCHYGQGYLFSRPLALKDLLSALRSDANVEPEANPGMGYD